MGWHDIVNHYWVLFSVIEEVNTICSIRVGLLRLNDAPEECCFDLTLAEEVVDAG